MFFHAYSSQKTKTVIQLIFWNLEVHFFPVYFRTSHWRLGSCCQKHMMTIGKNKSLTENKIRSSLFLTNTKTVEFIEFSLLDFFFSPKRRITKCHLWKTLTVHPPMSVVGMPGRREEDTYRSNLKHIVFSRVLQKAWRRAFLSHRVCSWLGTLHRFENTVRVIINGSATKLPHLILFL